MCASVCPSTTNSQPANFVVGHGPASAIVHCIDFGLSKRYRHPRTLQHIAYREGRSLTGTPRYASINNHLGIEQSRRDDLESIGYVLIYFLRGILPWQGLKAKTASKKYKMIMEKKQSVSVAELCHGCPVQFAEYLSYCRSLSFDGNPDMFYLRGLFRDLYVQQGFGVHQSPPATMPSMTATGGRPTIGSAAALAASAGPIEWDWDRFVSPAYYSASAGGGVPSAADGANVGVKGRAVVVAKEKAMKDNAVRGRDLIDIAGGDDVRKEIVKSASGGEGGIVAMQSSDSTLPVKRQQQQQSPLHQLKESLRISDDGEAAVARGEGGGGADNQQGSQGKQSHKRHLSLSQVAGDGTANYATKSGPSGAGVGLWGAGEGGGGVDGGIYKQQMGGCRPKTGHALQQQQSQAQPLAGLLPDAFMAGNGGKPLSAPTKNAKEEEGACAPDAMPGERVEMARLGGSDLQGAAALGESMGGTKADSFLNGILRKAKSFARHSSATVSGPVDPADNLRDGAGLTTAVSAPLNPSLPGRRSLRPANASASSLKGGLKGGMGGNAVASAGAAGGQERASAGTSGPRIAASSSSSSKHMSGGFGQTGLAVPS